MKRQKIIVILTVIIIILAGCSGETYSESSLYSDNTPSHAGNYDEIQSSSVQSSTDTQKKCLSVRYVSQLPDYPTGCEGCSAVMALDYAGVMIDPEMFFSKYLKTTEFPFDPYTNFCGNPRDDTGFGCFASALCIAMNKALQYVPYTAETIYGKSLEKLCETYIDNNIPVIIWASVDMAEMRINSIWVYNGKLITWKTPEHCLVLVGYDENNYIFNDPMRGKNVTYSKESVQKAYKQMGRQAVIINRNP